MKIKPYPEKHMQGIISIEKGLRDQTMEGDFGIQIASDGRVWVCIDGEAFIRFRPFPLEKQ